MLVLTRKLNEEIMIGDDIKVTLIRVKGNTVRIGIEAPRDVRIIRGELEALVTDTELELEVADGQVTRREEAFAHPVAANQVAANRLQAAVPTKPSRNRIPSEPQLFVGTVKKSGADPMLTRAPLADFVSAT